MLVQLCTPPYFSSHEQAPKFNLWRSDGMRASFLSRVPVSILTENAVLPHLHHHMKAGSNLDPALQVHKRLERPRLPPLSDPKFCVVTLLNCKDVSQIRQVHAQISHNGMMLRNLTVLNKLLYIYAYYGALEDARALFNTMIEKDTVSWTVMIGSFAKFDDHSNSFRTFREFIRYRAAPFDNFMLPIVIRSCRACSDLRRGEAVHGIAWKNCLNLDYFVCAALVDLYAKCGMAEMARKLFDEMPQRDLVTWTVMIGSYAEKENAGEALALFNQMRKYGFVLDRITMVTVVNACAKLGSLNKAREVHCYIIENNFLINTILSTAMIDMYAKCGNVDAAREVFNSTKDKNVVTWSTMIAAYGYHGQGRRALDLLPDLLRSGILPNKITFMSLLYACSHSSLVEDGLRVFSLMRDVYNVHPDVKHCTCVVDMLGRAGRFKQALKFMEEMDVEKDKGLWGALLGACRIHKRIDLAERAAEVLLEMKSDNPGHYALLSNIYASAGRWEEMARVRDLMACRKLKKLPGWTWIEVEDKVHRFGAGDQSHHQADEIYAALKNLMGILELAGYVPDTNYVLHDAEEGV